MLVSSFACRVHVNVCCGFSGYVFCFHFVHECVVSFVVCVGYFVFGVMHHLSSFSSVSFGVFVFRCLLVGFVRLACCFSLCIDCLLWLCEIRRLLLFMDVLLLLVSGFVF